jgi:succinate-semialdehyde dehydrogenase/glutarate-semialdehyde dehydrogenase
VTGTVSVHGRSVTPERQEVRNPNTRLLPSPPPGRLPVLPRETAVFVEGDHRASFDRGTTTFPVHDPATGEVLAHVVDQSPADAVRALDTAVAAADAWAAMPSRARGEILRRAFDLLVQRREEFALLMTREMGKPLAEARGEVAYGGEFLRWFAEEAVRIDGRYGPNPEGTGTMIVTHRPVGPCYLVTPWNFPLAMATRKIAPALAAGCTVVVKPAELTPLTTIAFVELLREAGLPDGVVTVLTTTDARGVTGPLLADPRLRKLSFTGSTAVGKVLMAQSAENVLRTSMELGGNAPFVVMADADLDAAVDGAMLAKFRNTGQACTAANRLLVHESVADEFVRRLADRVRALVVGAGTDDGVTIGPLIDDRAVDSCAAFVDDAVARGARVVVGGGPLGGPGSFFAPTVLSDVPRDAALMHDEIFGPVAPVTTFVDEDDAVRLANDTPYGLVAYLYTTDLACGHRLLGRLRVGMLGVNTGLVSNAAAPFGGVGQSGIGREGGREGIHEYLDTTYALVPTG